MDIAKRELIECLKTGWEKVDITDLQFAEKCSITFIFSSKKDQDLVNLLKVTELFCGFSFYSAEADWWI